MYLPTICAACVMRRAFRRMTNISDLVMIFTEMSLAGSRGGGNGAPHNSGMVRGLTGLENFSDGTLKARVFLKFGQGVAHASSSPRVRGTPHRCQASPLPGTVHPRETRRSSVHPRACGERPMILPSPSSTIGSSPRVRGTHCKDCNDHKDTRFIPARAGNANRGLAPIISTAGSSPRVRGTPAALRARPKEDRFIPARAGNATIPRARRRGKAGSSPRVRGTLLCRVRYQIVCGSSPRVRGTPQP